MNEVLELVETVRPAVAVELAARLGVEGALGEDDLGRLHLDAVAVSDAGG
jgi:hypothetical protein